MKNKKKSILFLVNVDTFFVSHRLEIGKKLLNLGFEVHIASKFLKYENKLTKLGFKIHHINLKQNTINILNIFFCIIKIAFILYKIKPKIFHLISLRSIILGGLSSLICPVNSFVFSITGIGSIYLGTSFSSKIRVLLVNCLLRLIFFRSKDKNKFLFQNYQDLKFLQKVVKINKKDFAIIKGSGIQINRKQKFIKIINKTPVICMISRLIADKGVNEYIQAIKICKKLNYKFKFLLIGDPDPGNPTNIDINYIKKLHKDKIFYYYPYKQNIFKFIRDASLIVLPSYREGFPRILIEAASQGRPVITTNTPGCRDAIINNKTGILVPARNGSALAKAIIKIAQNRNFLNAMGKNAMKHAEKNFDIEDVIKAHLNIYEKLN